MIYQRKKNKFLLVRIQDCIEFRTVVSEVSSSLDDFVYFIYLNTVIACGDTPILHLNIRRWVGKFTFSIRSRTFLTLKFPADFELQPSAVFLVQHRADVQHGDRSRTHVGWEGHDRSC